MHSDWIYKGAETFECGAKSIEPASMTVVTPSYGIGGESLTVESLSKEIGGESMTVGTLS